MYKFLVGKFTVYETAGSGQHRPCSFEIRRTEDNSFIEGNKRFFRGPGGAIVAGRKRAMELNKTEEVHHLYGHQKRSTCGKAYITFALCGRNVPDHLTHSHHEIQRKGITCLECYSAWLVE